MNMGICQEKRRKFSPQKKPKNYKNPPSESGAQACLSVCLLVMKHMQK